MDAFTSYAQNFEDVILWRALGHVRNGLYIDVGAQSPLIDSVSKGFYDRGWRGIHVEPSPKYSSELNEARPDELVIEAAVGAAEGQLTFFDISDTGLSTTRREIAERHAASGFGFLERIVPTITLDQVFEAAQGKAIHWLKIDVEGSERDVLEGWRSAQERPWVLVIESTLPLSQEDASHEWEPLVLAKGYRFVYFDGLNRFYLADGHDDISKAFLSGPNVFDGFILSGTSSSTFCAALNHQLDIANERLDAQVHAAARQLSAERESSERELALARELAARQLDEERRNSAARSEALTTRSNRYRARLQESEEQVRTLNASHHAQVDRFQAHAQWLENEWALSKARNDELDRSVNQLRIQSDRLDRELRAVFSSTSWKVTAPLRGIKYAILGIGSFISRSCRWLVRGLEACARRLLAPTMHAVLAHPRARAHGARLLRRMPQLEHRVRQFALGSGMLTQAHGNAAVASHAIAQASGRDADAALSQRTIRVLADLARDMDGEPR